MLLVIALTVNLLPLSAMAEEFISDDATWEEELEDPQMMEEYLVEDYEETYEEANIVEEQIEGTRRIDVPLRCRAQCRRQEICDDERA